MFIIIAVLIITGMLGLAVAIISHNPFFGFSVWTGLFGGFILQGLRKIPAQPPHKGILTVWGERQPVIKAEGWRFFPIYPWWYGAVLINVTKINQDLPEQIVRTPDLAELAVPISITFTPDKDNPENLIVFLNSGGESGVKNIIQDIVRERIREWAIAVEEGPQTWQAAMRSQDEATKILVTEITGEDPPKDIIKLIRRGNGILKIPQLGIVLNRLNVGEIKPKGQLAEVAESEVKEAQERRGEVFEVDTDIIKARQLVNAAAERNETLSLQEAYRIILEWKATREGRGFTIPGISPLITEIAKAILGR